MEAYEAPAEEVADRKTAAPAVVVGVGDDEAREHEEEIDGQVAVVDAFDRGAAAGKGVPFEDVVPDDRERRNAAQPVEQVVVGFRVGKGGGVHFRFFVLGSFWDVLLQRYDSRSKGKSVCGVFLPFLQRTLLERTVGPEEAFRCVRGAESLFCRQEDPCIPVYGLSVRHFLILLLPPVTCFFLAEKLPLLLQESIKISYF